MRILLVEADRAVRITVRDALEDAGHVVLAHDEGRAALSALDQQSYDLLLTDVRLPGVDGISLLRHLRCVQPDCSAILMTAYGRVEDGVAVLRDGALDYIGKPFDIDELLLRIERAGAELTLRREVRQGIASDEILCRQRLVGDSPPMAAVRQLIEAAARADVNVLVTGETGTGKDLCARALHRCGLRAAKSFVHVNCAAISAELLEAEMFGRERGAFTGATRREGRMAAAHGGTLFLDEVGELPLEHQAKLLHAIDSGAFEPLGSNQTVSVDACIVSATNRDLREQVAKGTFRQDLYFRLGIVEVVMPPLRDRRGDIPVLVAEFLQDVMARRGGTIPSLTADALAALTSYAYPGNVRELFHALEHGLALSRGGPIDVQHLPRPLQAQPQSQSHAGAG